MPEARKATIRRATKDDIDAIFLVLQDCAPEIPTNLDSADFKTHIRLKIGLACSGGQTRVVVVGDQVIGFLLAQRMFPSKSEFELTYGGVLKNYRRTGLFTQMLDEIKRIALRLEATVSNKNQCKMVDLLLRAGFAETEIDAVLGSDDRSFEWSRED